MYDLFGVLLHPGIVLILAGAVIALLPKTASRYLLPLGALAALAEDYGMILLLGCAFILLDLVTGLAKAKISGPWKTTILNNEGSISFLRY